MSRRLLLTRPYASAVKTAQKLEAMGFDIFIEPMLNIENKANAAQDIARVLKHESVLLFTSANASHAVKGVNIQNHALAVGNVTAECLKQNGVGHVSSVGADVQELMRYIENHYKGTEHFIYVRGDVVQSDLAGWLKEREHHVEEVIAYHATPVQTLSYQLVESVRKREYCGILFYSQRSAALFAERMAEYSLLDDLVEVSFLCLSKAIASVLQVQGFENILIAKQPNEHSLLELMGNFKLTSDMPV